LKRKHLAWKVSIVSLGMEHPRTQHILMRHLTLLAQIYTDGDLEVLLELLAEVVQVEVVQDDNTNGETIQA
jgi:hypothetical protein